MVRIPTLLSLLCALFISPLALADHHADAVDMDTAKDKMIEKGDKVMDENHDKMKSEMKDKQDKMMDKHEGDIDIKERKHEMKSKMQHHEEDKKVLMKAAEDKEVTKDMF
ncbi:hypothetical protein RJD38_17205 [Vibrio scophthalmi]|uniref:Pentapeptide MXKDX repeat protein n=2 Tax=Vibrio scophthalmi TaxID=45658 RepID=F9RJW5_9VIBR|nr:hypothetical protein [Vibrio scophthalmi]ANU39158.1 hypothetical protein VSVS05_04122 [Vibrio scophthalmi]EGU40297.1 hypothetical protein VIS19158_00860 [Vibrio scophthalmi LMG 19158]